MSAVAKFAIEVDSTDRAVGPYSLKYLHCCHGRLFQSYAYRKEPDLITAPDDLVTNAAEEFTDKTAAIKEIGQTDDAHFKVIGGAGYYFSTLFKNCSHDTISRKICTTIWHGMRSKHESDTCAVNMGQTQSDGYKPCRVAIW